MEIKSYFLNESQLPKVYEPITQSGAKLNLKDFLQWMNENEQKLLSELKIFGGLLFRSFDVNGSEEFEKVAASFIGKLAKYTGGDSPRSLVTGSVYTSTVYPPSLPISLHNEMSYTRDYPTLIFFYCETAPEVDGETPIADCRKIYASMNPEVLERFAEKKLTYIQNLFDTQGIGKSWQETFESKSRESVESVLNSRGAQFEWKSDGCLRIAETVNPILKHVSTHEKVFFSQAHQWHPSALDISTRASLLALIDENNFYHNCTYGDGTLISDVDIDETRRAVNANTIKFPWAKNDVLLLDNVLVAHGRSTFKGPRRILVAMG